MTHRLCWLSVLVPLALAGASTVEARGGRVDALTGHDKLYWEAAQALYGVGLDIRRTATRTTLAPKAGGLTQERYNQYVREAYLPVLQSYLTRMDGGSWRWSEGGYLDPAATQRDEFGKVTTHPGIWDPRGRVKRAHLILEPYLKFKICAALVGKIGDKPTIVEGWTRKGFCALEAMQEAISSIYEYRGQAVTWNAPADRGGLKLDEVIWKADGSGNYPITITVRGGNKIYTLASTRILFELAKEIDSTITPALHREAQKLYQQTLRVYRQLVAKVERDQRRLAGRNQVIFGANRFYTTIAQAPARGPLSCKAVFYLAYAPKEARQQGYHLGQEVNGVECAAFPMSAGEVDRNEVTGQSCHRHLKPGSNTISVGVYLSHDGFNYSRPEWRRENSAYRLRNVTYTATRRGRKLYGNSITCQQ